MNAETGPTGQLTVGFVPGVTPGKWFRRWEERHPGISLSSFQSDIGSQTAILHDGRADLSFVRLPVDREGLSVIPLYEEQPVVVASRDHEVKVFDEIALDDLADENRLDDADVPAALELVAAGVGILILPMAVARHYNRKDVLYRPLTGVDPTTVALAWLADKTNDVVEEFIGVVRGRTANSSRQPSVQGRQQGQTGRQKSEQPGRARSKPGTGAGRTAGKAGKGGKTGGRTGRKPGKGGRR